MGTSIGTLAVIGAIVIIGLIILGVCTVLDAN